MKTKIKTYRLAISKYFPKHHPRAGEETLFAESIRIGKKIHTIRDNYEYWAKRIKDVQDGKAVLVLFEWEGKPYRSKQKELFRFDGNSDIGIEKSEREGNYGRDACSPFFVGGFILSNVDVALHDGLSYTDFDDWFRIGSAEIPESRAIIHFTKLRYAVRYAGGQK